MRGEDLAKFIADRFIARYDVMAEQAYGHRWHKDGAYYPLERPFTLQEILDHINGRSRRGHYLLNQDDRCKLFAFDLDYDKGEFEFYLDGGGYTGSDETVVFSPGAALRDPESPYRPLAIKHLRAMAEGLAAAARRMWDEVTDTVIGFSGSKGLHVYCLFDGLVAGEVAKRFAQATLVSPSFGEPLFRATRGDNFWQHRDPLLFPGINVETFPKQITKKGSYGNLMRLPYGIHAKSGQYGFFIDETAPLDQLVPITEVPA